MELSEAAREARRKAHREWKARNPDYYKKTQKERNEYLKAYLKRNPDKRKQYEATKWENKALRDETDKLRDETDNKIETDNETDKLRGETDNETDKCSYCGNSFEPKRSDAVYCSSYCRLKAHRQTKRA